MVKQNLVSNKPLLKKVKIKDLEKNYKVKFDAPGNMNLSTYLATQGFAQLGKFLNRIESHKNK